MAVRRITLTFEIGEVEYILLKRLAKACGKSVEEFLYSIIQPIIRRVEIICALTGRLENG